MDIKEREKKRRMAVSIAILTPTAIALCGLVGWGVNTRIERLNATPTQDIDATFAFILAASQSAEALEGTATPSVTPSQTQDVLARYSEYATQQAEQGNIINETEFPMALTAIQSTFQASSVPE